MTKCNSRCRCKNLFIFALTSHKLRMFCHQVSIFKCLLYFSHKILGQMKTQYDYFKILTTYPLENFEFIMLFSPKFTFCFKCLTHHMSHMHEFKILRDPKFALPRKVIIKIQTISFKIMITGSQQIGDQMLKA